MQLGQDPPDPADAGDDPEGFAKASFWFFLFAGIALGILRAANEVIGDRVVGLTQTAGDVATNAAESASENSGGPDLGNRL